MRGRWPDGPVRTYLKTIFLLFFPGLCKISDWPWTFRLYYMETLGILGPEIVYTFIDGWWEEGLHSVYSDNLSQGMGWGGQGKHRVNHRVPRCCVTVFGLRGKNKFKTRTGRGKPTTRVVRVAWPIGWTPRPGVHALIYEPPFVSFGSAPAAAAV